MTDCWPTVPPNWPDCADVAHNGTVLRGLRVLVTRPPDRSGDLVEGLRGRGALPVLAPMHQAATVIGREAQDLNALMHKVADTGAPDWLVFTSVNTVRALQMAGTGAHGDPAEAESPRATLPPNLGDRLKRAVAGGLRIAAVGAATAQAAKDAGLPVHLIPPPDQSSAAGLVDVWPEAPEVGQHCGAGSPAVYLPQSGSARTTLRDGLVAKGWTVVAVVAYRMLDWPATNPIAEQAGDVSVPVWEPRRAREELAQGTVDAVVATAPSLLRALFSTADGKPPGHTDTVEPVVCAVMGEPTWHAAQNLGLPAVAATVPDTAGLLDALEKVVKENRA